MIAAAALCPAPPLLLRALTGADPVIPELRYACLAAVADLLAAAPDVVAVVGTADSTTTWNGVADLDPGVFAPGLRVPGPQGPAGEAAQLPSALGVGGWLLNQAGYAGQRAFQSVAADEPADRCAQLGARLAGQHRRVALLVMGDGSATRTLKAPGYLDERSAGFDAGVERAVRECRLGHLLSVDPGLARELMAKGRPAWQVLAGATAGLRLATEIRYSDAPFGVAYLVASVRIGAETTKGDGDGNAR